MTTTTLIQSGLPLGRRRACPELPTPPSGWPVASYATCWEAQHAQDYLAEHDFPVQDVTMVGVAPTSA
jgi:hypothetical protein